MFPNKSIDGVFVAKEKEAREEGTALAGKKDHSTYMKPHAMLPVLTDRPLFLYLRLYQRWLQYQQTGTYLRLVKFYM